MRSLSAALLLAGCGIQHPDVVDAGGRAGPARRIRGEDDEILVLFPCPSR
ncbi:hypothetical protein ACFY2H_42410 [Streptomyces griseofuscus]